MVEIASLQDIHGEGLVRLVSHLKGPLGIAVYSKTVIGIGDGLVFRQEESSTD